MKVCPRCDADLENQAKHCHRCGCNVTTIQPLKAVWEFGNPGGEVMDRIHRKHRRFNLRNTLIASVVMQVLLAASIGFVQDWTLLAHAACAVLVVLAMHKLRTGHLTTILVAGLATMLTYKVTGHMGITAFLSLWLLSFWYAFLGYQIKMNNELHGKDLSA